MKSISFTKEFRIMLDVVFRYLTIGVFFLFSTIDTSAQSYAWRNVEIGGGGFVTGIVFHPSTPNLVYARTDVGGAYRLDPVTSRWIALNDDIGGLNNEFQHLGVLSIGVDPSDANKLYLATGQYGGAETWKLVGRFYRSNDRGATWNYVTMNGSTISGTTAYGGVKFAGNSEGRGVGEIIAVDPADSAKIVMGSSGEGLWRSTNGGTNWTRLTGFDNFGTTSFGTNFVIYAPPIAGPNLLYAAAKVTTQGPSLWRSADGGTTWTAVPNQPGRVAGAEMFALQGSFDAAGTFYMTWANQTGPGNYATKYEVWKLAVDGVTWTKIMPPTGQGFFAGVSADPRIAGHVLVTTQQRWYPGDEVYRSTDGGITWTGVLRSGVRAAGNSPWSSGIGAHWITDIAIDPFNSNRAIFNNGFGLISTTNLNAANAARTWTFFSDGLEELVPLDLLSPSAGPPLISVTGDYTGFRHDDLTRSPMRGRHSPGNGTNSILNGADLAPEKIIRQNSDDTYFSQDAGASWAKFPAVPVPSINGAGKAVWSAGGQRLLWCPSGAPAYHSTDNGNTWSIATGGSSQHASGLLSCVTLAGSLGTAGMVNSTGGNARFTAPEGIAVGETGIRYVADTGNHLIRKIIANESVSTLAGTSGIAGSTDTVGTSAAKFRSPTGIVASGANIYVCDTGNHTIRKITKAGVVTTLAGGAGLLGAMDGTGTDARFQAPRGIVADSTGQLYVADTGNHGIRKITSEGVVSTLAGTLGTPGVANLSGTSAQFNAPRGIAVDAAGNVYVADTGNHAIRKITISGEVSTFAGGMGVSGSVDGVGTSARFNSPGSIVMDASGTLYVADTGNHTVRKITSAGVVTTLAGSTAGAANGAGSSAKFRSPAGIAVEAEGVNVYLVDTGNHAIIKATSYYSLTPFADRVDDRRFYLWDQTNKKLLTSSDGGQNFSVSATGVNSAFAAFSTAPQNNGHIWVRAGSSGLYRSTNFGASFTKISAVSEAYMFGFGKASPTGNYPAVFLWGKVSGVVGFFRSDNAGTSWTRINDSLHQFGYINVMTGDPRVHGRVYLGTSGRGVIVGDPLTPTPSSQMTRMIYDDALQSDWQNISSSGTTFGSTSQVRTGTSAISIAAGANRMVSFSCAKKSTSGYAALSFWINSGTSTPPALRVGGARGGISLEAVPVSFPASTGWQRIVVPLSQIGLANIEDLTGLRIETIGESQVNFSLDDLVFVGVDDFNQSTNVTLTLGNLSATYDGSPKPVSVTTHPAGRSVVVTYDGSTLPPTAAGNYNVSAFVEDSLSSGSVTGTLIIAKASASISVSDLASTADGMPKPVSVTTNPPNLAVDVTYDGSATVPNLAGIYTVAVTVRDANYQGSTSSILVIRQPTLSSVELTGWTSNQLAAAPTSTTAATSSPLLNPDNIASGAGGTLQTYFRPITLANVGDKITLTGSVQLSQQGVSGQVNWFRYGLYDNRSQPENIYTGWLGYTGMGTSLWERVNQAVSGLYPTGFDALQRTPNSSSNPIGTNSPSGTPVLSFEENITRTHTGVDIVFLLRRMDTNATLMSYTYTDSSPNNNGVITGESNTANTDYDPTYNAAGFMFGSSYIGTSTAHAQFTNIRLSFAPGITANSQFISFPQPEDRSVDSVPFDLSAEASSGLPVTYSLVSGPAIVNGSTVTVTGVGRVVIRASQSGNASYLPAPDLEVNFNVVKASGTIFIGNLDTTYSGTSKPITATTQPPGLLMDVTYNGSSVAPVDAGSYPVVVTINDPTYQGSATGTLVISQAAQTIDFREPPPRVYGDAPFELNGSTSSNLPLTFRIVSGPATVSGSTVTLTGAGTVVVSSSQSGDNNYLAATDLIRSFVVAKATALVSLGDLEQMFDGQSKSVTVNTIPAALDVDVTYSGNSTLPVATGSYPVIAAINDINYQGTASGTLVIQKRTITSDLIQWNSNISNKVTWDPATPSSPLLNPNDTTDASSTNTLQADFAPITMTNIGDKIVLTGRFQMTATPVAALSNWFRFGLYDRLNQPLTSSTGWLGLTGMGNSLYERTSSTGLYSTGNGATQRSPSSSPAPVSSTSPTGNPLLAFEVSVTRVTNGIVVTHQIKRTDTNAILMNYSFTDTTPNNNGLLSGAQNASTNPVYSPTFNTAGFAFSKSYVGNTGAMAQFQDVKLQYTPALDGSTQSIHFSPIADRTYLDAPFALSAIASSGLPVSFLVVSGPATLNGNNLTITGAGTVVIRASQAGSYTYLPAQSVEQSFVVAKAEAEITLSYPDTNYDGTAKEATVTTFPPNLQVVTTYDGSLNAPWDVGNYSVIATVEDANFQGTNTGSLVIGPSTPYQGWRTTHFGTAASTGAAADGFDADNDGENNLLEFATAQNPFSSSRVVTHLTKNGNMLEFTYLKNTSAVDLIYTVEWSDNLQNDWSNTGVTSSVISDNATTQQIKALVPVGAGKRFVRLKVTQ